VSGAENGAERAEKLVSGSGAVSGTSEKREIERSGARSGRSGTCERERSGTRAVNHKNCGYSLNTDGINVQVDVLSCTLYAFTTMHSGIFKGRLND
jgi:hypothetical protein